MGAVMTGGKGKGIFAEGGKADTADGAFHCESFYKHLQPPVLVWTAQFAEKISQRDKRSVTKNNMIKSPK